MKGWRARGVLERGAPSDVWRHTLSQIPSVFGRLVYLSSLRNANTGDYEHHGLELLFGKKDADGALRLSHSQSFQEWLNFNLEQQQADLNLYISGLLVDRKLVMDTWTQLAPYRNLMPINASPVERDLFLTDLETMLSLLKAEYAVFLPGRGA